MPDPSPLEPSNLTWVVLLAQWMEFAKSALALPREDDGALLRDSVADIIALQAVWFALREIDVLPPAERSVGADRAQVLIEKHAGALESRWPAAAMPAMLRELIADARALLAASEPEKRE